MYSYGSKHVKIINLIIKAGQEIRDRYQLLDIEQTD
ncbi:hypothetical protein NIES932_19390 [Raphidiopsis curvata NIES-932]|nr:hypothetical protein NIES932_19390 [Raphidiopsis curvata NIES-932]